MSKRVVGRLKQTGSHLDIEWEIKDFLSLPWGARYDSPTYPIGDTSWCFRLHQWVEEPHYSNIHSRNYSSFDALLRNINFSQHALHVADREHIGISVIRRDSGPLEVSPTICLSVKTTYGTMHVLETKHTFEKKLCESGGNVPVMRAEMLLSPEDLDFLISGAFTVICTLKFDEEREVKALESKQDIPDNKFACDCKQLLLSGEGSDVTFLVKGQKFQAHRIILGARSPVFASMLSLDMKEKNTGLIDIEDCDPEHFLDFLCFLYSGSVKSITSQNACSLYRAADKYDVQDLKSECLEFMRSHLDVDNLCDVIALASQYDEADLMKHAIAFKRGTQNCPYGPPGVLSVIQGVRGKLKLIRGSLNNVCSSAKGIISRRIEEREMA